MAAEDVNHEILMAVLHIMEAWVEDDKAAAGLANGLLTRAGRKAASRKASSKRSAAVGVLEQRVPANIYPNLIAGLQALAPSPKAPVGKTARRWGRPQQRLSAAKALVGNAMAAEQAARARADTKRRLEEQAAARIAAEEALRAAETERKAKERSERAAVLARFRAEADSIFDRDFLQADEWFLKWDTGGRVTRDDFTDWKAEFVRGWANEKLGDSGLDIEQARAVATTSHDLRLVARAGSGKTRTVVTRALFLQMHCRVDPGAIMLVAFNNKAVEEISTRIRKHLPRARPHVVTFHALAYALLRPEEALVFDDEDAESYAQSQKVQAVVDAFVLARRDEVKAAMLRHFKDDWTAIVKRGLHLDREAFLASRAAITKVTLGGEFVKSYGERVIANALFAHDVDYKYERNFTSGGFNYRPDFTVVGGGKTRLVIEYFGVTGDAEYERNAEQKRTFWKAQSDIAFVEFKSNEIASLGEAGIEALILEALDNADIKHRKLSDDELWERVRDRAVDTFSKALRNFVNRARQLNLNAVDVRTRLYEMADPADGVASFVELAADVYEEYLARAASEGYEDFSGVMWRATEQVKSGVSTWIRNKERERGDLRKLRFIHIDEFQDFSLMFMEFVQAIRAQAPEAVLCCVGDDWQAINGFAGADLSYFNDFESTFPGSATQPLATNHRSAARIVSAGNAVMHGLGPAALAGRKEPGRIHVARLDDFKPAPSERDRFPGDVGTPALLRLLRFGLDATSGKVAVLFRRNAVPWFISAGGGPFSRKLDGYLANLLPHFTKAEGKRLEISTTHKFKGREADFVVVADADEKSYPLLHPTAELFGVFGDTIDNLVDAERRLFYVATTRAESQLCFLITKQEPSPFLKAVVGFGQEITWNGLPALEVDGQAVVEIRVHDGFEIKEKLKPFGFTYDGDTRSWYVLRPAEEFDFNDVKQRLAFVAPRLIELRDQAGRLIESEGARLNQRW